MEDRLCEAHDSLNEYTAQSVKELLPQNVAESPRRTAFGLLFPSQTLCGDGHQRAHLSSSLSIGDFCADLSWKCIVAEFELNDENALNLNVCDILYDSGKVTVA